MLLTMLHSEERHLPFSGAAGLIAAHLPFSTVSLPVDVSTVDGIHQLADRLAALEATARRSPGGAPRRRSA